MNDTKWKALPCKELIHTELAEQIIGGCSKYKDTGVRLIQTRVGLLINFNALPSRKASRGSSYDPIP